MNNTLPPDIVIMRIDNTQKIPGALCSIKVCFYKQLKNEFVKIFISQRNFANW